MQRLAIETPVRRHATVNRPPENVRDVTMCEDAQHLRSGTAPQVMAAVRSTAALRLAGFTATAAGRRWGARNPARPLAVLNLM